MDMVTVIGAVGALVVGILGAFTQLFRVSSETDAKVAVLQANLSDAMDDIRVLKKERDHLRETLQHQTNTLSQQSDRLTETINALTKITLQRDGLVRQVATLTAENEALKREVTILQRRLDEMVITGTPQPVG